MKRYKLKNIFLLSLVFMSQIHTLFRGMDFNVVWILNNISKTPSHAVYVFFKHLSEVVLLYCLFRPKGVNRDYVLLFLIISILDVFHFVSLSGFGFGTLKIILGLAIFLILKSKYTKWQL